MSDPKVSQGLRATWGFIPETRRSSGACPQVQMRHCAERGSDIGSTVRPWARGSGPLYGRGGHI